MNNGPVGPKGLRSGGFKSNTTGLHDNFVGNMAQLSISTNKVMYCMENILKCHLFQSSFK